MKHLGLVTALLLAATTAAAQQATSAHPTEGAQPHAIVAIPAQITWGPAPAILPAGARAAVLQGNPADPGPFTLRLVLPANYRIPPHFHPVTEHVTVISGAFHVGMGDTFDATKADELPTGTFAALAPGTRHFAFTRVETVIQLHGVGPWSLTYVNPADDPRGRDR